MSLPLINLDTESLETIHIFAFFLIQIEQLHCLIVLEDQFLLLVLLHHNDILNYITLFSAEEKTFNVFLDSEFNWRARNDSNI